MYRAKILLMSIVLAIAVIFTVLTLESVEIDGEQVTFCRNIEFWCRSEYSWEMVVYDRSADTYSIEYPTIIGQEIEVKDGEYIDEDGNKYLIDLPDGKYQNLEGYFTYDEYDTEVFVVLDENTILLGSVL